MAYNDYANELHRLRGPVLRNDQVGRLGMSRAEQGLPCMNHRELCDLLASTQQPMPHHHRYVGRQMREAMNLQEHRNLLQQAALNNMYNQLAVSIEERYTPVIGRPAWQANYERHNPPAHCPPWRQRQFDNGDSRTANNIARGVGAFTLALGAAALISRMG